MVWTYTEEGQWIYQQEDAEFAEVIDECSEREHEVSWCERRGCRYSGQGNMETDD